MTDYEDCGHDFDAPSPWVLCPAHGVRVGIDKHGHVTGRCPDCAAEAAKAQRLIEVRSAA